MLVPFEELPATSRVWIYQANRTLTSDEVSHTEAFVRTFIEQWQAHGKPVKGAAKVYHQRFLAITADEGFTTPTGCSIDASVHCVQELEQNLGVVFTDRSQVAFLREGEIFMMPMQQIKAKVAAGEITPETVTFNTLVTNKHELESRWTIPAGESWLSRYFS